MHTQPTNKPITDSPTKVRDHQATTSLSQLYLTLTCFFFFVSQNPTTNSPTNRSPSESPNAFNNNNVFNNLVAVCEQAVEIKCPRLNECEGTETNKKCYGKLMSCLARNIRREPSCEEALAWNGKKGIGHVLAHEAFNHRMYMLGNRRLRRRQQETNSCGQIVFSICGDTCASLGSEEEVDWYSCIDMNIYGDDIEECQVELADEEAWEFVATNCGF